MSTALIDNLITGYITAAARAEEASKQRRNQQEIAAAEEANQILTEDLGELWSQLEPYARIGDIHLTPKGDLEYLAVNLDNPHPLELAPFKIFVRAAGSIQRVKFDDGSLTCFPDGLGRFLAAKHQHWQHNQAKKRAERIDYLRAILHPYRDPSPEDAIAAFTELNQLAPDRGDEWCERYQTWLDKQEAARQAKAEAARKAELNQAYIAAYVEYLRARRQVDAANAGWLAARQAVYDVTYLVWKLEYGKIAEDPEDQSRYLETDSVYVLHHRPGDNGCWSVARSNGLASIAYFHPISLEGPITTCPTQNLASQVIRVAGRTFYLHPAADGCQVRDLITADLKPDPPAPEPPAHLDYYEATRLQHQAEEQLTAEIGPDPNREEIEPPY